MTWPDDAACHGMDTEAVFVVEHSNRGRGGRYSSPATQAKLANALAICHRCPVVESCKDYVASWDTPPRGVVIAAMTPHQAWQWWHSHNPGHTKRTA
jgi:hypothetical protein